MNWLLLILGVLCGVIMLYLGEALSTITNNPHLKRIALVAPFVLFVCLVIVVDMLF